MSSSNVHYLPRPRRKIPEIKEVSANDFSNITVLTPNQLEAELRVTLFEEGIFPVDSLGDDFNISRAQVLPHLRESIYVTTQTGFRRNTFKGKTPTFAIILPRVYTQAFKVFPISAFVLHGVECPDEYNIPKDVAFESIHRSNFKVERIPFNGHVFIARDDGLCI